MYGCGLRIGEALGSCAWRPAPLGPDKIRFRLGAAGAEDDSAPTAVHQVVLVTASLSG
jgi:hypothetical protein